MADLEKTYVFFSIKNYSNSSILSSYSLPICPLTFIPNFTTSDLLSSERGLSTKKVKWNFGDDTFSTDITATHLYTWPGEYTVTLTVYDKLGNPVESEYKPSVFIKNFVADEIQWEEYGKFIYDVPASKIGDPLYIITRNSWQSYNVLSGTGITINLYASGAAGDYISEENFFTDKWSHLRLLSRFYEKQKIGNTEQYAIVDTITAKTTEIYAKIVDNDIKICSKDDPGAIIAGVTGRNEIFYVDDRVKNWTTRENPIFLIATFDTSRFEDEFSQRREIYNYINYPPAGFQTYAPTVLPIIKVRHNPGQRLSITTTGIDGEGTLSTTVFDIPKISWQHTSVPFIVKFKDFENFTTKTYQPLSSSMVENVTITNLPSSYDLQFGIIQYNENKTLHTPVTGVKWYEDFPADAPQSIGGFYKGYFISDETANNCVLTAAAIVVDPVNFSKDTLVGWVSIPQYSYVMRIFRLQEYDSCQGSITLTLTSDNEFVYTNNDRNIYAISVAPSGAGKGNDYHTWLADANNDVLIKFNMLGHRLSTICLSGTPTLENDILITRDYRNSVLSGAAPSNIALDGNSDLWVALFDGARCIKIDGVNGYVKAIANPPTPNVVYNLSGFGSVPFLSGFAGESFFLPASIDTDADNNLWVAYSHAVSNVLVKYTPEGVISQFIYFPPVVSPIEICIDRDKYIWLSTFNHNATGATLSGRNDLLYKFDTYGNLMSGFPLDGFRTINNITVDGEQNCWVTEDRETLTKVNRYTNERTHFQAGSGFNTTNYICSLVGVTCDTSDYIWVINDLDKKIYRIDTYMGPQSAFKYSLPIDLPWPSIAAPPTVTPQPPLLDPNNFEIRQYQAYGDWLGFRWVNKYMVPTSIVRTLTGESSLFDIYPNTGVNNIAKINEDFDAEGYYKSLRYQEILLDKEKFFTDFLGGIVGDANAQPYELGKTVYEKIANFVDNKSNITKCNISSLISFCQELSISFEEYNYPFPPQLERLINLLTIKHKHLWGETNKYNENFAARGTFLTDNTYGANIGDELSVENSVISSGSLLVAYEFFADIYSLVNFSQIPDIPLGQTIPLSTYSYDWGWGLVAPKSVSGVEIKNYYRFFNFIPTFQGSYYDNTINWKDKQTTLSPYNSSYKEWSRDNGIMQTMLSYELTKGLRLFTSAANITYNN